MTVKELFNNIGIYPKRNAGSEKVLCPKCSHTRKKKNDPCLNIDLNTGEYFCHNQGCEFKGCVVKPVYEPKIKEYIRPVFNNNTSLTDAIVKYFQGRGISQNTLKSANITDSKKFMPQLSKEVTVINFNYFRDSELINIKYRPAQKMFMMVKDAELIFYGLNSIKDSDWCVITEGEMDCLSFYEAGVLPVVSVPNGASKGNANLEYLDNCIQYFENKTKIIIATDDDEAGMSLRAELARRLGSDRCYMVNFNGCKDANEFLVAYGPEKLRAVIDKKNLIEFPILGVIQSNMIWDDVENLFINGLDRGIVTGTISEFDEKVSFVPGQLMVLTGIPNHGKSPFALQIMCSISISSGWKWALYTPEHKPLSIFVAKICECLLGKRMRKGVGFSTREKELAKDFINEHFYFIEPEDDDVKLENIIEKVKLLVKQKGIRGFLIDPWNKLEHSQEKHETETAYISRQLDTIIRFDQKYSVFTIIIAHPTKIRKKFKENDYEVPNLYDIAGSSNWFNKPDIGITFYRNYSHNRSEIHVQKMKYDHLGSQGCVHVLYNVNNSRFNNINGTWDNSNWLLPKEIQPEINFNQVVKTEPVQTAPTKWYELTPEEGPDAPF